ncbi:MULTISPECIES: outer membrane protein Omp38 [unclassified Acinetobacter]|uniref:outer membrane protein Omp38 n=1 Tax=unclassified Acinetobacter TaxID=196816 RepID=UPI0035BB92C9
MKMTRIALAMLVAAPFAAANAGVTVTPLMLGYNYNFSNTDKGITENMMGSKQDLDLRDGLTVGAAIGAELTPAVQAEIEYQKAKSELVNKVTDSKADVTGETASLNIITTADAITKNYDSKVKPYALVGGGWSRFNIENGGGASKDTIGNVGVGALWHLNDALSLRTEARGVHNFDHNYWSAQGLAALQVVLGGHLKPQAEVVEVAPVEAPAPVAPQPVQVVQQPQQPQVLTEDLKMELRVFFDTNKSNIKPQYRPEIAKVAEALSAFPNATAKIDGHTDNTGPRKLNERLSLARANSVKSALVHEFGVDANRLTTQGFAWDQPIADNKTREGRAMNRRVFATITGSRQVQR